MRGNTIWNFKAIAQMYGYCVKVQSGVEYFKISRLPNIIPHKLYGSFENTNNILVITFYRQASDVLPVSIPHILGADLKVDKIKKVYDIIKPAQVKVIYLTDDIEKEQAQCEDIQICVKDL